MTNIMICQTVTDVNVNAIIKLLGQHRLGLGNLLVCMQIALTIPVTSASCERSFSAMKLVKTCLRNRTGDQRLTDLMTLFTCKERTRLLDSEVIIDYFANASRRRVQFI